MQKHGRLRNNGCVLRSDVDTMSSILFTVGSFIVALGILITVHEFGHFWVARKLGVKVLRFSVGFGKPLLRYRERSKTDGVATSDSPKTGTEYVLAAIPLGGYVKMLDEREGEVAQSEVHQAFNRQTVGVRSAIVFAGPLFNFIFAIIAFWLIFVSGDTGTKPWVGEVEAESVSERAGFKPGDLFLKVNGNATLTWQSTVYALLEGSTDGEMVTVEVADLNGVQQQRLLPAAPLMEMAEDGMLLQRLGIKPKRPELPPVIGTVVAGEAAANAGLQTGDRVLSVGGVKVDLWAQLVEHIRQRPLQHVQFEVERDGRVEQIGIIVGARESNGEQVGRIGAGVQVPQGLYDDYRVEVRYGPGESLTKAVAKTWEMSGFMLKMMGKMITGDLSVKNLSGPISIAQAAGQTASYGLTQFIKFLALVSISLGVLNLLPVPVLDGGHLFFFLIEAVKGSPVSDEMQFQGQRIGMVLLLGLMGLAFYVDLARVFG